ncbi:TetR/AcrR family transcriptional regulator [Chamaesiphon minutus]|uniref:Transcriptional regulator n=1 Tax=Chamaesiphon minutus (strain ATCC 27169 / PCC 6605) TaxID=1173020 RepID=K9UIT0_CHAP6|nr:TetR/AcrR family transcriptional regulator [Chamaesiphon minutus]AFY94331.1 transcriptional regulator [Chamaesiphon minutus PCC 6605]
MGRPLKANSLTPQDVIDAAIACLDREGESALGVNRVARELGIKPPAIYKHLEGNTGLRRAVALQIWCEYLIHCRSQTAGIDDKRALFLAGARATRNFAKSYPARYAVMMEYQLRPTEPPEAEIIQQSLRWFQDSLQLSTANRDAIVDTMRMVNAAIYGFIIRERSALMTLDRDPDASYEVMLLALLVAIEYIQQSQ